MLRHVRARFRRKDTDAIRVLAIKNSVHRSPWHIAPTMQLVIATTASKLRGRVKRARRLLTAQGRGGCEHGCRYVYSRTIPTQSEMAEAYV